MTYTLTITLANGAELDDALYALNESDLGGAALDTISIEPKR